MVEKEGGGLREGEITRGGGETKFSNKKKECGELTIKEKGNPRRWGGKLAREVAGPSGRSDGSVLRQDSSVGKLAIGARG